MYGISDPSQLSSLFGVGVSSFQYPGADALSVSTGTFLYGVNNARPSSRDKALLALKTGASDLKNALTALTDKTRDSVFSRISVQSSDDGVASAEAPFNFKQKSIALSVTQLASGQISETNAMKAEELDFNLGDNRVTLRDAEGKIHELHIRVEQGDTNESVLRKFADAADPRLMGVTAEVSVGGGGVSLAMRSIGEGTGSAFEVFDKEGMFVGVTGLSVSRQAQNAVYTVDDAPRTSQTNDVLLSGRVRATLRDTGDTTLSFGRDRDAAARAVNTFVSAYNKLASSNEKIAAQLYGAASAYAGSLRKAGVEFNNGQMSIDEQSLGKALSGGAMRSLFSGGANYGYSARLSQLSQVAERSPQLFAAQPNTYSSYNAERLNTQQNQVSFMLGLFYNSFI